MALLNDLNLTWFILLGVLMAGYAILDGFDLGVGILHPFARGDEEKRLLMQSIGPLWDGNEVWLVTFGGAMFAAFPDVYATAFSAFYLPFMLLLFALIGRAVSMEFRSKVEWKWWRAYWDFSFFGASTLATFLFGVAVGNIIQGIPIGPDKEFTGTLLGLLNPYAILTGCFVVSLFALHGGLYLYIKTTGELHKRVYWWVWRAFGIFLVLYVLTTIYTLVAQPHVVRHFQDYPWAWAIVVLNVLAIANIPRAVFHGGTMYGFLSSAAMIVAFVFLLGAALYPYLLPSSVDPEYGLTIYNAASSQKTLWIMRLIAVLGMPFVLAYTTVIYWVFRGKVELDPTGY